MQWLIVIRRKQQAYGAELDAAIAANLKEFGFSD